MLLSEKHAEGAMAEPNLSPRQQKCFASVRASLERETGKTLAEWVAIAHACPETGERARLKWMKDNHGLLQNRATHVLAEAFGSKMSWRDPAALIDALWTDRSSRAIFEVVDERAAPCRARSRPRERATPPGPGVSVRRHATDQGRRRDARAGGERLRKIPPSRRNGTSPGQSGSESRLVIPSPAAVSPGLSALLRAAWENS